VTGASLAAASECGAKMSTSRHCGASAVPNQLGQDPQDSRYRKQPRQVTVLREQ
jgi:hypothetical protein